MVRKVKKEKKTLAQQSKEILGAQKLCYKKINKLNPSLKPIYIVDPTKNRQGEFKLLVSRNPERKIESELSRALDRLDLLDNRNKIAVSTSIDIEYEELIEIEKIIIQFDCRFKPRPSFTYNNSRTYDESYKLDMIDFVKFINKINPDRKNNVNLDKEIKVISLVADIYDRHRVDSEFLCNQLKWTLDESNICKSGNLYSIYTKDVDVIMTETINDLVSIDPDIKNENIYHLMRKIRNSFFKTKTIPYNMISGLADTLSKDKAIADIHCIRGTVDILVNFINEQVKG